MRGMWGRIRGETLREPYPRGCAADRKGFRRNPFLIDLLRHVAPTRAVLWIV